MLPKPKNLIPAILVMLFIFILSSTPGPRLDAAGLGGETIHVNGHFLMFTALCLAYYKAVKKIPYAILLTIIFGVSDELHQLWTPFRACSFEDVLVDSFGALIAGLFLWKLQPYLPKILKNWLAN